MVSYFEVQISSTPSSQPFVIDQIRLATATIQSSSSPTMDILHWHLSYSHSKTPSVEIQRTRTISHSRYTADLIHKSSLWLLFSWYSPGSFIDGLSHVSNLVSIKSTPPSPSKTPLPKGTMVGERKQKVSADSAGCVSFGKSGECVN